MELIENERIEDLQFNGLKIIQNKNLYCFTSDAVLLANFAYTKSGDKVLEIGTGSGIISILVCAKNKLKKISAIEAQSEMAKLALKNVSLNGMEDKIEVVGKKIQEYVKECAAGEFDVVICNPPYKKDGAGGKNENSVKAIARHEILINLKELIECVCKALKFGGKFFVVYDANRLSELICELKKHKIEPKRIFFTQPAADKEAVLVFVEAVLGGKSGVSVLPALITNDKDGNYITRFIENYKKEIRYMLYIVGTPIGNLDDISKRALDVLESVDVVACEDTRNSIKLLNYFNIKKHLITYHKFNERDSSAGIIDMLKVGKNIAIISDSGMPVISDPGNILIKKVIEEKLEFTVIPVPNAAICGLILSGFDAQHFSFVGFLPNDSKSRKKLIEDIINIKMTLIFYVSPHSLEKDIAFLEKHFRGRKACLVREITKKFESRVEFVLGEKVEVENKGEFVLITEGAKEQENKLNFLNLEDHLQFYIGHGFNKTDAIKKVAKDRKVSKNEVYQVAISSKKD